MCFFNFLFTFSFEWENGHTSNRTRGEEIERKEMLLGKYGLAKKRQYLGKPSRIQLKL